MAAITIRNLSDETHRALKARAASAGRSTEAEIRLILEQAARPERRVKLGSLIGLGQQAGGVDLETVRDPSVAKPVSFK